MNNYLARLERKLIKTGYDQEYTNLCLEYSSRLLENGLPVVFDKKHLSRLIGIEESYLNHLFVLSERLYKEMEIPKKSGNSRHILIPTEGLKYVQRWILHNILYKMKISDFATGFRLERSIVDNAKRHTNKECLINLDIKDFFPSITIKDVFLIFYYHGYTYELSFVLAKLCTFERILPQGAPTSPFISNIRCLRLDKRLGLLTKKFEASYTRYADDICISGQRSLLKYLSLFKQIIREEGFVINEDKTRISFKHEQQRVTGLIVNDGVTVPRDTKKYLRQQIHYCKTYGVNGHLKHINSKKSNYKEHLYGLAFFIKMVEKKTGEEFLRQLDNLSWNY